MKQKQSIPKHLRFTLGDFNTRFPDDNSCLEYLKEKRFPGGVTFCEKCKQDRKHHRVTGRPHGRVITAEDVSPMAGTIFEKTPLRSKHGFMRCI